jgi:VWFA-related protein
MALGMPTTSPGQEPAEAFEDMVEVSEVLLDVLATDDAGNVVHGLGAGDFLVEEAGQPVELSGVSYYTTRYDDTDSKEDEVPSSRYIILFFHDQTRYGIYGGQLVRQLRKAAEESQHWVADQMLPSDWVAVASYDVKLKLHQDFTQNRKELLKAIEDAVRRKDPEQLPPSKRRKAMPWEPSLGRYLPVDRALRRESSNIYKGLRLLAASAGRIVGRKNLILFSLGFGIEHGSARIALPDRRYYRPLQAELNDHNIAIYPLDLTPVIYQNQQWRFLESLANDTGGRFYRSYSGFGGPLEKISNESYGYYLLSYRSEHPAGETGYQKVKVQARDRNIKIRARQGYRYGH